MIKKLTRESTEPLIPHIRPHTRSRLRKYLYACLIALAVFFLYRIIEPTNEATSSSARDVVNQKPMMTASTSTVKLDIYMESLCPDTTRFFRQQLRKAWDVLGASRTRLDLTIVPFGKARCVETSADFQCECQHGALECDINQLMNCVIDRIGFPDKYIAPILCMQGKHSIDEALKCVEQYLPVEANRMRECATGPRGRRLLALSGQKTAGLEPPIDFIPWIVIDGRRNSDALYDLSQNLCESMKPMPSECQQYMATIRNN
ncbi:unnamed protein product [Caenorhabditis bovis]|uniref:Gamma interferon inducible lysosomal thiol reductase n=1 Tax=Caenorhabditis bovis TaxID=2654633 RepID=A0A8S1EHY9_9PELO|nr:unnamed protein product [Caenorhabditis bovis]